ncbi:MAG: chromosomal replication initiator protein DnaA [Candidatus Marinimicrobia bacterium]|nr:chromosomal replication initiator protein DnaA [Candidatus Neomarinimicrobiota bacterium]
MDNIKYDKIAAWKVVYNNLKKVLPGHAIHAWFDPIKPISFNSEVMVLGVPSQFFLEWIDSHYSDHVQNVLNNIYNSGVQYRFIVQKSQPEIIKNESIEKETPKKSTSRFNNLNSKYTFDKFIVGDNNEFAKTASESVSKNPGENNFNPLIIYGGVGLGKTHLMHAIGNSALEKFPSLKIVNITSEQFTLDFVNSLRKNKTIEFAQNYRSADVLLIDDIQFFRGKEQTQEQFFHTFNVLHQSGKQIVLTADKFPGEMKGLQTRLLSRFQSGLSVDVQPPNFEVRVAILLEKAEQNGLTLDYSIIEFIAKHIKNNVRDLEGTIIRILAKSSLMNIEIDNNLVADVIKERVGNDFGNDVSIENIVKKVSQLSKVSEKEIIGKSRKMEIAEARQLSMYLCRDIMGTSLMNIGVYFGGRDHTTVMHAVKTIDNKKTTDIKMKKMITSVRQELGFSFL